MANIICPNCRTVVPAIGSCSQCGAPLAPASAAIFGGAPVAVLEKPLENPSISIESLAATEPKILSDMDPRLQRMVLRSRQGIRKARTASTGVNEVAVIAKVTSPSEWENLSEVRMGAVIAEPHTNEADYLVTGRIPVARIEHVRLQACVKSLKPAQRLTPSLAQSIEETGARRDLLPPGHVADGGRGVVIGIIDFGCDFVHQNVRDKQGRTRLLSIWNQGGPDSATSPFGYGTVYTRKDIDAALKQRNPYQALGYGPPLDTALEKGSHGTHVMDIAAGNGLGTKMPGMAPNADIVFVEVSANDIPWNGPEAVGTSFGDSVQLLEAVRYIFDVAGDRPCVINASLGTNGGPHDGTSLVEQGIDRLLTQAQNRAMVIAASNSYSDGIHASGTVRAGHSYDLTWDVPTNDATNNELEVWYDGNDRIRVEIIGPDGTSLLTVDPGQTKSLNSQGRVVLLAANRLNDPNNGDNMIGLFLERNLPLGTWTVRLHGTNIQNGAFHAWIERDDAGQSSFGPPQDNSYTLGSISCGRETIIVGSYDAHKNTTPLSYFSSAGPTRDGREKPEVSAPGHDVLAAHSRTQTGVTRKSGTSMASPAVAGIVALVMAEAKARGHSLTTKAIINIIKQTARRNPPPGVGWDPRYGAGRISASAAVAQMIAMIPGGLSAKSAKKRRNTSANK
jgi:hypothetical protein